MASGAFSRFQIAHPGETIYAFALLTDEDALGVYEIGHTRENLARKLSTCSNPNAPFIARLINRMETEWSHPEWTDDFANAKNNHPADSDDDAYDTFRREWLEHSPDEDDRFRRIIYRAMCDALHLLDERGHFGSGELRRKLTLFISISDSEEQSSVEIESASELNPWHVSRRLPSGYPFPSNWMQAGYHFVRRRMRGPIIARSLPE